ncbi:camphor resistance protein CrcB [Mycobacterium sp. GA-1999]|nr:camphor resistance protein CrcB [Mycobacterium sp. IS-1556]KUH83252.1 camphor resistance protein CrcB [Mycobacterium sp. GA-0227b]KUH84338.1 camphor resistance protein CrcB [Mycobacterium sp. GA-1999]
MSCPTILTLVRGYDGRELLAVFVGGALGTVARAAIETLVAPEPGHWPWPTFAVNIVGAFVLGYVATRLPEDSYRRPLLGTGLCGGLTTFSTMQVEMLRMIEREHFGLAVGYAAASVIAGLGVAWLGSRWARR